MELTLKGSKEQLLNLAPYVGDMAIHVKGSDPNEIMDICQAIIEACPNPDRNRMFTTTVISDDPNK